MLEIQKQVKKEIKFYLQVRSLLIEKFDVNMNFRPKERQEWFNKKRKEECELIVNS